MLVELAFETTHVSTELCPAVIDAGTATNDVIVGASGATVAAHVVVATVEDASVACKVIVCVPGETARVCVVDVLPLPHKREIGSIPVDAEPVHAICVALGKPEHETDNADAALTHANESKSAIVIAEAAIFTCVIDI